MDAIDPRATTSKNRLLGLLHLMKGYRLRFSAEAMRILEGEAL